LVENSAQLWSTSPKKTTQQREAVCQKSCCAAKTAENAGHFSSNEEAHPEGILGQFPPTIPGLMYFHFWTWKLAVKQRDMLGYRTVCYLCDTMKK